MLGQSKRDGTDGSEALLILDIGNSGVDVRLPLNVPLLRLRALSSCLQHYHRHPASLAHFR